MTSGAGGLAGGGTAEELPPLLQDTRKFANNTNILKIT
jgi:hypothetical protein